MTHELLNPGRVIRAPTMGRQILHRRLRVAPMAVSTPSVGSELEPLTRLIRPHPRPTSPTTRAAHATATIRPFAVGRVFRRITTPSPSSSLLSPAFLLSAVRGYVLRGPLLLFALFSPSVFPVVMLSSRSLSTPLSSELVT